MAEIKTCEQYVLAELSRAEAKIEELETLIKVLKTTIEEDNKVLADYKKLEQILYTDLKVENSNLSLYVWKGYKEEDVQKYEFLTRYGAPKEESDSEKDQSENN